MSEATKEAPQAPLKSPTVMSDACSACEKIVYPMEKLVVENGRVFHKSCFRCTQCHAILKLGDYGMLDNKHYCKPHFKQLFALKGSYFETPKVGPTSLHSTLPLIHFIVWRRQQAFGQITSSNRPAVSATQGATVKPVVS